MVSPVDERIIPNSAAETQGLRKLPRNLHPCQGIRVADDLRSGDIRKVTQSGGLGVLVGKIVIVKTIVLV